MVDSVKGLWRLPEHATDTIREVGADRAQLVARQVLYGNVQAVVHKTDVRTTNPDVHHGSDVDDTRGVEP